MLKPEKSSLTLTDFGPKRSTIREEVMDGLQNMPKTLPSKYFYDQAGSCLFDEICELEEYYPTRTELEIMQTNMAEIVARIGPHCQLIEYGSGSSTKTRLLLDALPEPAAYVPIDISKAYLLQSVRALMTRYPGLEVDPVCADYTTDFAVPSPRKPVARRVAYFPGSTIGNFDRQQARNFLVGIAHICQGGGLLIGVDLKKDPKMLHRAYNDRMGVTALFNLNLLLRLNTELGANFQLEQFAHYAFYQPEAGRIEMHLVSLKTQSARLDGLDIPFKLGESIWTESSYKYTLEEFAQLAGTAGFTVQQVWTDPQQHFSVQYLTADHAG
jgi:dimethylhistidine N-methyltransferase